MVGTMRLARNGFGMVSALVCAMVVAGCGGSGTAAPAASSRPGEHLVSAPFKVPAPALASNRLGDPAELSIAVWLPNDYETSGRRYRTVYYLTGWQDHVESAVDVLGKDPHHPGEPLIIVAVDGINALGGSFYRNSPITGNWADAIAKDLVSYVDGKYRTLPAPASRGITGHSMGGYGALQLAFDHPEVFGAVDALSPGVVGDRGMTATQVFAREATTRAVLTTLTNIEAAAGPDVKTNFLAGFQGVHDENVAFALGYGVAVAGDPSSRSWMRFPVHEEHGALVEDLAVMATWNDGFGNWPAKVAAHHDDLVKLRALQFEYARADEYAWIPEGCRYLDTVLTGAKVAHTATETGGGHDTRDRLLTTVLPMMSQVLASG